MKRSKKFYLPIKESSIFDSLLWISRDSSPYRRYYSFGMKEVPIEIISMDPFLRSIFEVHPFSAGVLMIPASSIYNWHVDDNRGASLNMLISGEDSRCFFTDEPFEMVNGIHELRYSPRTYYLFNTQEYHSVINTGSDRYLFSVEFLEDKNSLSYFQLLNEYESGLFDA